MTIDKSRLRDYTNAINPENGTKGGTRMVYYPILIGEMAKREIQKKALAQGIGVCNKLDGKAPFTWPEVKKIRHSFFPDIAPDDLFATAEEARDSV